MSLLVFFGSDLGLRVGDVNVQGGGTFDDAFSFSCGDTFSDLSGEFSVGHHEAVELVDVVDEKFLESKVVPAAMPSLSIGTITDVWHWLSTTVSTPSAVINTFNPPPAFGNPHESVRLMPSELLVPFFQDRVTVKSFLGHF